MLRGHMIRIGVLAGFSIMLWGCAGNLPEAKRKDLLDQHRTETLESAKNEQVLNPEAGEAVPVLGFDGQAAATNMNEYRKLLKEKPKIRESVGVGLQVRPLKGGD